jgi:AcrR family transcriptional regulator
MNQTPSAPRKGRKYDQVLDGAREVFLTDGFGGASMDDIARAAGVSKATLYSYFPDKRHLFTQILTSQCADMADQIMAHISDDAPVKEVLTMAASHLVHFLLSDFSQRIFRICVAEADRFPDLGRVFYTCGPEMGRARMIEYFETAVAKGDLAITDMAMAADQFSELCKACLWSRAIFGLQASFSKVEKDRIASEAVATFMARYAAT